MLWGRAANRCSICRAELVVEATGQGGEAIVGDACHIVANSPDGPRGDSTLSEAERNDYSNLILLCKVHHKQIDDQLQEFSVERLHEIKAAHEQWVRESLETFDPQIQYDQESYSLIVDEWERFVNIDNWTRWSSPVLSSGQPSISSEMYSRLRELPIWLLSRLWPGRFVELEASFENFRLVLDDFNRTFHKHAIDKWGDGRVLITQKFYRIDEWDPDRYQNLFERYEFHVDLVQDLMLELTRSANYICDKVRNYIFPGYRRLGGALLVETGPTMDMEIHVLRVEYRGDERIDIPYPGLDEFLTLRTKRDVHFG